MASSTLSKIYTTISIGTTADDVTSRNAWVRVKNLGANQVSYSEISTPTGAATAGNQSTLLPAAAGGKADEFVMPPNTQIFFRANTGATLLGFEEIYNLPQKT